MRVTMPPCVHLACRDLVQQRARRRARIAAAPGVAPRTAASHANPGFALTRATGGSRRRERARLRGILRAMPTLRSISCALAGAIGIAASCAEGTEPLGASEGPGSTSATSSGGATAGTEAGTGGASMGGRASGGDGGDAASSGGDGPGGEGGNGGQAAVGGGGQGGSGDPCAADASDDACDTCRKPSCCAELTACSADALCVCWVECIDEHANDANKTAICSGTCGAPAPSLGAINGVFDCQQACASCPPIPWE